MSEPTVYVVSETGYNILPAKKYGDLRIMILSPDINKDINEIQDILKKELKEIQDEDYLLCIGNPIHIGLAIHFAIEFSLNQVNILVWDKRRMEYDKQKLEL